MPSAPALSSSLSKFQRAKHGHKQKKVSWVKMIIRTNQKSFVGVNTINLFHTFFSPPIYDFESNPPPMGNFGRRFFWIKMSLHPSHPGINRSQCEHFPGMFGSVLKFSLWGRREHTQLTQTHTHTHSHTREQTQRQTLACNDRLTESLNSAA